MDAVSKSKFKVGDRVRRTSAHPGHAKKPLEIGSESTIGCEFIGDCVDAEAWVLKPDDAFYYYATELELVTPATTSAIRTVARREIVPGEYLDGNVRIIANGCALVRDWSNASKARAAASLFNELADVLDENAGEVG